MPGDKDSLKSTMVTHHYVTAVVNTLDKDFFQEAMQKADHSTAASNKQADNIKLDPHMLKILREYVSSSRNSNKKSTLSLLKTNHKKRKRSQVREPLQLFERDINASLVKRQRIQ